MLSLLVFIVGNLYILLSAIIDIIAHKSYNFVNLVFLLFFVIVGFRTGNVFEALALASIAGMVSFLFYSANLWGGGDVKFLFVFAFFIGLLYPHSWLFSFFVFSIICGFVAGLYRKEIPFIPILLVGWIITHIFYSGIGGIIYG